VCGLFGWVSYKRSLGVAELTQCRAATALLAHRGPDYQGEWFDDHTYMGHRRLSIIDLSAAANQPVTDPSGRHIFIYNGEAYNYLELRAELEREGCTFQTDSDTEVFLTALLRWGRKTLTRVDGMFAAALHDKTTGEHLLIRDPLGQKPLYYFLTPDGVIYASELRALLSLNVQRWKIDRDAFLRYLMMGNYGWEDSPIVGIRKLLPGCCLRINRTGARIERYWDSFPGRDELDISEAEAIAEFDKLFDASCMRSMRADVPYGVFLSGGIDSSLVASYCRRTNPAVRTVSVAMSEQDYDESEKAATVNARLGIVEHHTVTMSRESVERSLTDVLVSLDEPHADPGYVNTHFLARSARRHMVVGLAGDGGDELFAGYAPFAGLGTASWLRHCPAPLFAVLRALARCIPANDRYLSLQFKAQAFLQGFPASEAMRFPLWLASIGMEELQRLCPGHEEVFFSRYGGEGAIFGYVENMLASLQGRPLQQQLLYYYQKVFLPEFVCMHTDRAAMQSSLEVRSPFLSLPLIEFANRLPDRIKRQGSELKLLLRRVAARQGLPPEIVSQRKQGFTFPLARWLKTTLRGRADELLMSGEWEEGLIDRSMVQRYLDDHMAGRRNNYRLLYNLMVFHAWRRNYPSLEVA